MKKIKLLIISVVVACCTFACTSVFAVNLPDVIVSLQINNPVMEVNGVESEIDAGRGTKPVVISGRTLVPIRAIIEKFGGVVEWDNNTQSAILKMDGDTVKLTINSKTAYFNNSAKQLDVAPVIINGRTMLPIRFVAESFNLGVAWENDTRTVSVIRNSFDQYEYAYIKRNVPAYSGNAYYTVNNNTPFFDDYEKISGSFEYYSDLDTLGRCDVCFASVATDIMPVDDRESISSVTPTGWINATYSNVDGGYLYNRCHLIGFQLTGENANKRNLITGTRYLNIDGMLPFENDIAEYVEKTGNHVMYRVSPVFTGNNLVADGVLLEAYSVEDNGKGISFCVYCYNVQPDITIDYATGKSYGGNTSVSKPTTNNSGADVNTGIYRTPSGKKYHFDAECGGKNSYATTLDKAKAAGLTPCSKCAHQ